MDVRIVVTVLCGFGLYASLFMQRKAARAEEGLLVEPSVVQTPRARLIFGLTNASFGIAYYAVLGTGIWFVAAPWEAALALLASLAAASMSAFLAYSLVFVTKMPCPYCWASHVINWSLLLCNLFGLIKISHWQ